MQDYVFGSRRNAFSCVFGFLNLRGIVENTYSLIGNGISKHNVNFSSADEMNMILAAFGAGRECTTTAIQSSISNRSESINQPTPCARQLQKLQPPR